MTNKILLNLLGFNPDLTSRQSRVDSVSILSRQSDLLTHLGRIAAILLLVLTIGVGNVWGAIASGTYELVTSTSGLVAGEHYIIASSKDNGSAYAIALTSKTDNRATVEVTVSSQKISVAANSNVMTFTLGGNNTNGWTFSTDNYAGTAGMLAATSSSNNRLGVVASPGNDGKWDITFASGVAKPVAKGSYSRKYMKYNYNNGTPIFNCYNSSGSESVYIYRQQSCTPPATALSISSSDAATVGTPLSLTTSGGNGGSVTWSVSNGTGTATLDGSTLNPTGAGTVTVTATQGDNAGKCGAAPTQTITITRASATITLSEAGATSSVSGTHYGGDSYTLPSSTEASCGSKVLVGWSTVTVAETNTKPSTNYYDKGTTVTLAAGENIFYAVFATVSGGGASNATKVFSGENTADVQFNTGSNSANNSLVDDDGYTAGKVNVIFDVISGTNYSYYDGTVVRYYANNSITVTPLDGATITRVEIVRQSTTGSNSGVISVSGLTASNDNTTTNTNVFTGSATSAVTFTNNGQCRFTSISITYSYTETTYSAYSTNCCTPLGTINGSFSYTSVGTTGATANWSWNGATTGISKNILKVYKESDNSLVATIDNISGSATSQVITGLDPCTEYYVKLTTVSSGGSYCDGVADQAGASHVTFTTSSYTVTKTGVTNVTAASLSAIPATTCASGFGPITIEAASGYVLPAEITVTGASHTWNQASGALTISSVTGNVSITITPTAASCSSFSFHTGTGEDATVKTTNTTTCFSQVNSSTTWKIDNYVIPADTKFFVGERGFFYDDNLGSNNSRSAVKTWAQEMFFEYTKNYGDGYRPTVGQATGAIGTLYIWSDNNWNNLHVGFSPQGYVFKLGSTNLSMSGSATLDANRYWETEVITLTSTDISGNYQANLYTGSTGGVASNNTQSTAVNTMGVKTNAGDNWRGTAINAGADANTRGFFRIDIGDGGTKNWHAHWVPTHRVIFHSNYPGGGGPADTYSVDVSVEETNNSIALASAPSAPTGYTFAGWYDAADGGNHITTARTISAGASANVELWAHWTANTIALTLNKNTEDAGSNNGSGSIDFDATSGTISTAPTRTGYTVEGYYTDAACTAANKVLTNTGAVVNSTVSGYTTSGKWTRATTPTTLYTKWTPNNYTVTWYAGGTDAGNITTEGSPTTSVAYGSKVTTLPTDPDGAACDKTFVGWTNTTSYTHGTSLLFTDAAGSSTITGVTNFYAVYATGGATEYVLTPAASLSAGRYVIAAYDDSNSKFVALTGAVSAVSTGSNSDMVNETTGFTISEGKFTSLPTGACEFVLTAYTGETDEGFYIQNPADDKYLDYQDGASGTNRRLWYYEAADYEDQYGNPTTPFAAWYGVALSKDGFPDNGMYLKYVDESYSLMSNGSGTSFVRGYANDNTKYKPIYLFKKTGGLSGYTITCADCGTSVTPTYTASPTGGTVSVTKSSTPVSSGSTVKTCTSVDLTVTITPASHYTLTGFTATGLSTGTATISPAVGSTLPKTTETTFTVTVSSGATGTLNLTPTFTEDAHVAINWHVPTGSADITAGEGKTWVYSGGNLSAIPNTPSSPTGCSEEKTFVGWSEKHSGSTEEDASYYDDLFSAVGDAPTGITSQKDFYAVYAHGSSNPLAGTVIWDEPFTGFSADDVPTAKSSGATVYNSSVLSYACADGGGTTKIYSANLAGGTSPELLVAKSGGSLTVSNIPTAGQTELTLSYKANYALEISSGTSGVTIGDASVEGSTYTRTITISQSPSAVNNFSLVFTKSTTGNARLDDIHLVVPGSSSYTNYVTDCEAAYIITYIKNTTDPVTNLPGETGIPQSTGAGTLSSKVPVRDTYTFLGWATTAGGNVAYAAGGSISGVSADMDLYAVWEKTPVEELFLNYSELNKYVGDPAVTLEVTGVTPEGADATVTWSSNNSSVASVVAATGVVTFGTVGTATITATSTVTGTTTAYCYVTVRNKPTASFTDLIHDGNGTDLSTYYMQNVAGTAIVFPTLDDYATPGDDCDSKHYIFVGWTTSDNNDDPEDHLVASGELEDDQDKVFYAVWADGEEGVSYTQLTTSTFKTSPTKYVIGAIDGDDTFYFNSCAATDANNGNGGCTNAPGTNAPIEFTLSGTAGALVATSTEATARYLTPLTAKNFQMSATSKTIQLNADGTIANPSDESWTLRFNTSEDYLRWYSSATGNAAYFYEVTSGAAVSYRTSCCTNNVLAPTVIATNTAYTVTLTWAAVDGATGYEVSWNGGAFTAATSPCVKSGLTASTDYIYKVRATYDPLVKCGALVASGSVTTDDVYSVTYSGGTGTGSCSPSGSVAPASYEAGATVTLAPTNSFSLTSNTFAAWVVKDADDNDVPVSNNQFTMPAKNVTVTATWTAVQDKYYDRMHDGTDASHGGVADGEGKYYLVLEGCNYTVPTLTDDDDGDTDCHTTHYKLLGWIAYSHLKTDGSGEIKPGEESYIFQGGGTKSATGATYYAIWAIMTE